MTPERWQQVDALFLAALEREPGERPAFLDEACAGDDQLRGEVESMLASYERADAFLEKPAVEVAVEALADDEGELAAGQRLGRYDVVAPIGEGGMGRVYLAEDTRLRRRIALKVLPSGVTADADRVRRFEQEARAASMLNHPNVCVIHEVGETDDGRHFIAMEYVEGRTLREVLADGSLPVGRALEIGAQVASALAAAHAAGVVHRDVKPENLMLRPDGYVKVLDFGIAKLAERETPSADTDAGTLPKIDTTPGVVLGTVAYMSPEQLRGQAVDARSDIFSLGVVLYEMIAGRRPFQGETQSDLTAAILMIEPPPMSNAAPDSPRELELIVGKALRKDRDARYQHAKDLLVDLDNLRQDLEFAAKMERSLRPEGRAVVSTTGEQEASRTARSEAATTDEESVQTTSSAEYLVSALTRHRKGVALALLMLTAALASGAYFTFFAARPQPITSIAVLPFANESGVQDLEYLSDGISESLINSLSRLRGMKVIARSSSFKYKGREVDPQEVARALGVDALLLGRVVHRGDQLLISVELVDARDNMQLWGEQYNRREADLLAVQSEISREIAGRLRLHLSAGDERQLARRETANPQAYDLLLKGRYYTVKLGTPDQPAASNAKKAIDYFQQAIVLDPTCAAAYAHLSLAYGALVSSSVLDPREFTPKAEALARKAVELDESLPDAHLALARIKQDAWDWAAAEREYERALELNPNYAYAHSVYSNYLSTMGRHDEAIAESERARELNPVLVPASVNVGQILFVARRYDEAIESLKKTLELNQSGGAWFSLGGAYAAKGMYAEAVAAYQETFRLGGDSPSRQIYFGAALAKAGEREKARAILERLQTSGEYISPGELAVLYTAFGEREQAFASLEKAYDAHDMQLMFLGSDPSFDDLRDDPRFSDLMRRVGLVP